MKLYVAAGLLVGAVALHVVALYTGIYDAQIEQGSVWFDNVLHTVVGVAFGLVWIAVLEHFKPNISIFWRVASTIAFVALMAALWELLELAFYLFFKSHALGLKVYSPTLREALFDSASNIIGACLVLVWTVKTSFLLGGDGGDN